MNDAYAKLLRHPKWWAKRKEILDRDGNACRNCQSTEKLQVHHKQYHFKKSLNRHVPPWEYHSKYMVTLCKKCHDLGHKQYDIPTFPI